MKLDINKLHEYVENGLLKSNKDGDLEVFCYTPKVQYEKLWDEITSVCRGIVVDQTGHVVAHCLPKFFNLNECPKTLVANLPNESYEIFDKEDGSLIHVFFHEGQVRTTSKCSFTSVYARKAQEYLPQALIEAYKTGRLPPDISFAAEIRLPDAEEEMRRVTKKEPGLYFFAMFDNMGDFDCEMSFTTLQSQADRFGFKTVEKIDIDLKSLVEMFYGVKGTEGFVVKFSSGFRVKLKTAWYLYINKVLENMETPEKQWDYIKPMVMQHEDDADWICNFPDELYDELTEIAVRMRQLFNTLEAYIKATVDELRPYCQTRKDLADKIKHNRLAPFMFNYYDGKDFVEGLWKYL